MSELIDHIGASIFLQVAIEGWNEIFLLILISIMMISVKRDKTDELLKKIEIPLADMQYKFICERFLGGTI